MTRFAIQATWHDAPHLSEEAREQLYAAFPLHERGARTEGTPQLGSGAIYPVPETDIKVEPFEIPIFYRRVYSLDVGWNRTAALWGAYDADEDVLYLYSEYYRGQAEPAVHAEAIKSRGEWIPGVIDPASRGRNQHDGQQLLTVYRQLGLSLVEADNAVEAGIYQVYSRLSTGRLKIFSTLQNFFAEYRIYRRDDRGRVVKDGDHLMDAVRYMVMSGVSLSRNTPPEQWGKLVRKSQHQYDYSPFAGAWNPTRPSSAQRDRQQYRYGGNR